MAVLNVVRVPSFVVEPMIATSIVVVAALNVFRPGQGHSPTKLAMIFAFGLFHGLGFAGGLRDAMSGMPAGGVVVAIAAFSVGVEIGHQTVVVPCWGALKVLAQLPRTSHAEGGVRRWSSAAVSCAGLTYLVMAVATY